MGHRFIFVLSCTGVLAASLLMGCDLLNNDDKLVNCNDKTNPASVPQDENSDALTFNTDDVLYLDNDYTRLPAEGQQTLAKSNYTLWNGRWKDTIVTWSLDNTTPDYFKYSSQNKSARLCFSAWDDICRIRLHETSANTGNIRVCFKPSTSDFALGRASNQFETDGSTTNYTYYIVKSTIELYEKNNNGSIDWGSKAGNLYVTVLMHEIGHAIGLDHTNVENSVMLPYCTVGRVINTDDIKGAKRWYGSATTFLDINYIWVKSTHIPYLAHRHISWASLSEHQLSMSNGNYWIYR